MVGLRRCNALRTLARVADRARVLGAEQGSIDELANCIAITVLFRHPFGIPIPHTATLPKRQNQVDTRFTLCGTKLLIPEVRSILPRLQQWDLTEKYPTIWSRPGECIDSSRADNCAFKALAYC